MLKKWLMISTLFTTGLTSRLKIMTENVRTLKRCKMWHTMHGERNTSKWCCLMAEISLLIIDMRRSRMKRTENARLRWMKSAVCSWLEGKRSGIMLWLLNSSNEEASLSLRKKNKHLWKNSTSSKRHGYRSKIVRILRMYGCCLKSYWLICQKMRR